MSNLGYDETNFTKAISDLGRCENEIRDLNRLILELKEDITDLKRQKLMYHNRAVRYERSMFYYIKLAELEATLSIARKDSIQRLITRYHTLPTDFINLLNKSEAELIEHEAQEWQYRGTRYEGGNKNIKKQ